MKCTTDEITQGANFVGLALAGRKDGYPSFLLFCVLMMERGERDKTT